VAPALPPPPRPRSEEGRQTLKQQLLADPSVTSEISRFLDDSSAAALFASVTAQQIQVSVNQPAGGARAAEAPSPRVVLTKLVTGPLDSSQLPGGIGVALVQPGDALASLKSALRAVYQPLLAQDAPATRLLEEFRAALAQSGKDRQGQSLDPNATATHLVGSVDDEFQRWATLMERDTGDASAVVDALGPLRSAVQRTAGPGPPTHDEVLEVVETADQCLQVRPAPRPAPPRPAPPRAPPPPPRAPG